jgi:hypothetical protein
LGTTFCGAFKVSNDGWDKARLNKIGFLWNVFMGPIAYRPTPLKGGARLGKSKKPDYDECSNDYREDFV